MFRPDFATNDLGTCTVQAIAAAEILARHAGAERVLVVCPASLKHQWEIKLASTGIVSDRHGGCSTSTRCETRQGGWWGYRQLDVLARTLAPVMIRRRKSEVLIELPGRIDKNVFVPMTLQQRDLHEENRETVARIVAKWRRFRFLSEAEQRVMTCALQNMRMSCNSTCAGSGNARQTGRAAGGLRAALSGRLLAVRCVD